MRITGRQLRQIIREELSRVDEKSEKMKPGVKDAMDSYEKTGDELAGPSTPEKEKKRKENILRCAKALKAAGVVGHDAIGYQLQLYYESIGRGVSDSTDSLAYELAKLQDQLKEAAQRLLRRL
jgi:hypothetical protein